MIRVLPSSILVRLIQESLDAVLILDSESRIRYVNPAMEKLSGYEAAELLNEPLSRLLDASATPDKDDFETRLNVAASENTTLDPVREVDIRHRSGEFIPIELKAVDLGAEAGTRFFGAFMVDLRQRKNAEAHSNALLEQLEQQALTDALTGLPNRRAFDLEAERLMAYARRENWPVIVGMIDIDWFKRANDQFGHLAGDSLLRVVARTIQQLIRSGDLCGRIGGDEFGLLLPHATVQQAAVVAERIRSAIADQNVAAPDAPQIRVTVSIGLAKLDTTEQIETALAHADAALYQAKLTGRNRVIVAQTETSR
jgi:diguanylate cyclase (GGDEF)-like protein/PAS domain S-box-containing protein